MSKSVRPKFSYYQPVLLAEPPAAPHTFLGWPIEAEIARSGYTLSLPLHKLPKLPPRPSYPCPWLSKVEMDGYVAPLIARGWRVVPSEDSSKGPKGLMLGKKMVFRTVEAEQGFTEQLKVLMDKAHVSRRSGALWCHPC